MNNDINSGFSERVYEVVRQIPEGRVMTYGQIAAICGNPRAARIVGGVAHFGDSDMPWHRVVNKSGGLALGYPGGKRAHAEHLKLDGVEVNDDYKVNVLELLWHPRVEGRR